VRRRRHDENRHVPGRRGGLQVPYQQQSVAPAQPQFRDAIPADVARRRAGQAKKAYGKDPAGEKSEARKAKTGSESCKAKTVGALTAEYLRVHAKPTKKTWRRDHEWIDRYILPAWRHELVRDISCKKIQALIGGIVNPDGNNASQSARVVKLLLSKMFNFSLLRDYDIEFNPVQGTEALGSTTILRTDHMITPREIRVRLRWADGHIDTLPEPINANKFELKQQDSTGAWHSFDDANEVDEEGYLIFAQVD
jgi:hypothetical protein